MIRDRLKGGNRRIIDRRGGGKGRTRDGIGGRKYGITKRIEGKD
jgi:hypothetical protein